MKSFRLLIASLVSLACTSCAMLQWPARAASYALAPLTSNETSQPPPGSDYMDTEILVALRSGPHTGCAHPNAREPGPPARP